MRRLYTTWKFDWGKVITLSLILGVLAGLIQEVGYLQDTSFSDFFIATEWLIFIGLLLASSRDSAILSFFKIIIFEILMELVKWGLHCPAVGWKAAQEELKQSYLRILLFIVIIALLTCIALLPNMLGALTLTFLNLILFIRCIQYLFPAENGEKVHFVSAAFGLFVLITSLFGITDKRNEKIVAVTLVVVLGATYYILYQMLNIKLFLFI